MYSMTRLYTSDDGPKHQKPIAPWIHLKNLKKDFQFIKL